MKTIHLTRYKNNPILRPRRENVWEAQNVSNAGAVIYNDKVYLLYRAEGFERCYGDTGWPFARLGLAISEDGFNISYRSDKPVLDIEEEYEAHGVEDPRISKIGDTYYIVYVARSEYGDRTALATTKDFKTFKKEGLIMGDIQQRTSALFPEKINGEYVLLHRIMPNIWISYSKDLKKWYNSKIIMKTRKGYWDGFKIGIGAPPIKTKYGWLLFWHGVDKNEVYYGIRKYSLGIALLDLNNPSKVLKRQEEPILTVEEEYEKNGYYPNVVYTCGAVEKEGRYLIYYGCADRCLSVAYISTEEVEKFMRNG
ncbi:glycosidase [bacterium]|nr:glycosidase [bacterium]